MSNNITNKLSNLYLEEIVYRKMTPYFKEIKEYERDYKYDWAHLFTSTSNYGGHSVLIRRLIKMQINQNRKIILISSNFIDEETQNICNKYNIETVSLFGRPFKCIIFAINVAKQAKNIMVHSHPHDIIITTASKFLFKNNKSVYFLNHADHRFSFGTFDATSVLEVSGYGFYTTKERRSFRQNSFFGIPVRASKFSNYIRQNNTVCTMGSAYKYKPNENLNFSLFAEQIIKKTKCKFIFIGPSGDEVWFQKLKTEFPDNVIFTGNLSLNEAEEVLQKSLCYIDSFPITGGTAFTDAFLNGCKVFGLKLPVIGYSPIDIVRNNCLSELCKDVCNLLLFNIEKIRNEEINNIIDLFSESSFSERMQILEKGEVSDLPDYLKQFEYDLDFFCKEWKLDKIVRFDLSRMQYISILNRFKIAKMIFLNGKDDNNFLRAKKFVYCMLGVIRFGDLFHRKCIE